MCGGLVVASTPLWPVDSVLWVLMTFMAFQLSSYAVSDAGSLNGTYVDHERVDTAPLHNFAELQIGRFILVFLLGEDVGASPAAP